MDPIELAVISAVLGSQFMVVYRLGKVEQKLKDLYRLINNNNPGGKPCQKKRKSTNPK